MTANKALALIYAKLHATAEMTPEEIGALYDSALLALCSRHDENPNLR